MQKTSLSLLCISFILLILTGCTSKSTREATEQNQVVADPVTSDSQFNLPPLASHNDDTINIYGRYILFYGPEPLNTNADSGIDSELALFNKRVSKIIANLNTSGEIPVSFTTANNIRIYNEVTGKSMVVSRNTFPVKIGLLVTGSSQPPKLRNGLLTEEEYYEMITGYFLLPS